MKRLTVLTFFLLVPSLLLAAPAQERAFQEIRERYLSLRNTDTEVSDAKGWQKVADDMLGFVSKYPRSSNAGSLLFDASIAYEKLYQKRGGEERARRAFALLERIPRDYPDHMLADDALIRAGDIAQYVLKKSDVARAQYERVCSEYSSSELAAVAKLRLEALESGVTEPVAASDPRARPIESRVGRPVIVLDPGHGGEDFGAVGKAGLLEKDVTLSVALELEKLLTRKLGAVVRLTRTRDEFIPLVERTQLANDFEADLFVSLHANASPHGKLSGLEVYYLDNEGDTSSQKLAERENASTRFEGPQADLSYMLSDLIQSTKLDDSIAFANVLHKNVLQTLKPKWGTLPGLGVKRAPFYVLVGAHMPCVLVEMFFIDNSVDGKLLADKKFRQSLAGGLFTGIKGYLKGVS